MVNSGVKPKAASESCFVAESDDRHRIIASGNVVTVSIATTRCVGTVDNGGFLDPSRVPQRVSLRTLAETLLLTIRAKIAATDTGGTLGFDPLNVDVFLHKNDPDGHEKFLGPLVGSFGSDWQIFELDVGVEHVRFPADPCQGQLPSEGCGKAPEPRDNEISFVFTGDINQSMGVTFEVDWLTLEPKGQPDLALRPILFAHDLNGSAADMLGAAAPTWTSGLDTRDADYHAVDLTPGGSIRNNGAEIGAAVKDLNTRFGVERVHIVGHGKGGIDARQHVRRSDDVDALIMIGTPNEGSFITQIFLGGYYFPITNLEDPGLDYVHPDLAIEAMLKYNRTHSPNRNGVTYGPFGNAHDSDLAKDMAQEYGENDEFVSLTSAHANVGPGFSFPFATSTTDDESRECAELGLRNHACLLNYPVPFEDSLRVFLEIPRRTTLPALRVVSDTAHPVHDVVDDVEPGLQGVRSEVALVPADGVTQAHTVLIDAADTALFYVAVGGDLLRLELVSPSGRRIDATTPLTDPSVVHSPVLDAGPFAYTGYHVQAPETGTWTLEVTGTGTPAADSAYGATALLQLPPGTGLALAVAVDQEGYAIGDPVTITATLTADGLPVGDATVTARVVHPDGATTTEVVLVDDGTGGDAVAGDGVYSSVFTATTLSGLYGVVVSAEAATPAFTREQVVQVSVAPSATTFSGTIADHGVDADGDGRYDQLVIDVGVEVDLEAAYRVFGTLSDDTGTAIQQLRVEQQLAPGSQTVSLAFDGAPLFDLGHDGPYLLQDLVIEDVATETGLAVGPTYTTAAYAHTDFQRPPLLLTGNSSDHGAHEPGMEQLPYEELVVEVEVDAAVAVADIEATANLHADDGTFIAAGRAFSSLAPGLVMVAFHFPADQIFRAGKSGPYTLELFTMWGTTADGTPVELQALGVVAVTQPSPLEDFAPSPRFTVGGTVTGLVGVGLELELAAEGPPGTPATTTLRRSANGPFTFSFTRLVSGNPYQVRVKTQPTNPAQVCTVANASGTIEDANVTNVEVHCV
jgi:hypothetical protein